MRRLATKSERVSIWILQDGKCAICDGRLEDSFEVDHIVPFSKRGETTLCNLQALCTECHLRKHREKDRLG